MVNQSRVVGVADRIELIRRNPGLLKAPGRRLLRQFPCRERHGPLAVLAAAEPLFLRRGHDLAVHNQRRRGIVEDGVDAEYAHGATFLLATMGLDSPPAS